MEAHGHPFRDAFKNRDLGAMGELLADDVSFHSPVISEPGFQGKDAVMALYRVVFDAITDDEFTHEYGDSSSRVFVTNGKVLGQAFKATNLVEFDADGKAASKPLRGMATVTDRVGGRIIGRLNRETA